RIFMVARREFLATVTSKGFILGVLMMPVLLVIVFVIAPRIMGSHGPQVHGMVAVIDTTGEVLPVLRETLDPEAIAARKMEQARREAALRRELSERAGVPDEGEEE